MDRIDIEKTIESMKPWYQNIWLEEDLLIKGHGGCGDPVFKYILEVIDGNIENKRVLDLGANAGIHSLRAILFGAKEVVAIEALDLYHKQYAFIKKYFMKKYNKTFPIEFLKGYIEKINNLVEGKFDIILALAIMYHIGKLTVKGRERKELKKERENAVKNICNLCCGKIVIRERKWEDVEIDDNEFIKYGFVCNKRIDKSRIISCYEKEAQ